jgi:hypothetical protein
MKLHIPYSISDVYVTTSSKTFFCVHMKELWRHRQVEAADAHADCGTGDGWVDDGGLFQHRLGRDGYINIYIYSNSITSLGHVAAVYV